VIPYEGIAALFRHWEIQPPVDVTAAMLAVAWAGFKPKTPESAGGVKGPLKLIADRPPTSLQSLKSRFPNGAIRVH
jgi:hypothetical protein